MHSTHTSSPKQLTGWMDSDINNNKPFHMTVRQTESVWMVHVESGCLYHVSCQLCSLSFLPKLAGMHSIYFRMCIYSTGYFAGNIM